jgi:hypothetical protein
MNRYKKAFYNYQLDSSMLKSNTNHRYGSTTKDDEKLLQELVERATLKKVKIEKSFLIDSKIPYYDGYCVKCKSELIGNVYTQQQFCDNCGQALDWGGNCD